MLVAISGIFRVYIASLLLDTHVSIVLCLAGGLIIYSVYTLDRTLDSDEDLINRTELCGSCKELGFVVSIITAVIGGYILAQNRLLWIAFVPLVTGFLYSKGIRIGKLSLRLKGGLGAKNIVVGLIWGLSIIGIAGSTCKSVISIIIVFILYEAKVYINSVIDDFKDVKGDMRIGLRTLPVCLGERKTRRILLGLHMLSHTIVAFALINGLIAFEPVIIAYSFLCGSVYIWKYAKNIKPQKLERGILIDGESTIEIILRLIVNMCPV